MLRLRADETMNETDRASSDRNIDLVGGDSGTRVQRIAFQARIRRKR
jgi:hypothetical protein